MKLISKIYMYLLAIALLAWLLPWTFHFLAARPVKSPFTLYSCVTRSFAFTETGKDKTTSYMDTQGRTYTAMEFDSILPFFYYRQLMAKDRLPDSICGIPVTAAKIRHANFNTRLGARDVNVNAPHVYMIMDAMPSHVDLEEPAEVFRMTDEMTFIRMADNTEDREKSNLFTKVLKEKGFAFPMRGLSGNPTTKKEYDEGYILIDANHQVFHVKQLKGRPYVKNTGIEPSLKMVHALITEFPGRKTLALLTDEQHNLYALTPQYKLHRLPICYNPEKEDMLAIGDLLNWTVKITDGKGYSVYALDADTYTLADSLRHDYPPQENAQIAKALFPFALSFTSTDDKWVQPRLGDFSAKSLPFNVLLATIMLAFRRKRIKETLPCGIITVFFGIFAFVPFLVIRN